MTNYIHAFLLTFEMGLPVTSKLDLRFTHVACILLPMVTQQRDINKMAGMQSERKRQDSTIKRSGLPGQSQWDRRRGEGQRDCPTF